MRLESLESSHEQRLRWFLDRTGTVSHFPKPMKDGKFLVSRPKGIYKPADLMFALSIRLNLGSPYEDGAVFTRTDGTWYFAYHQEDPDPARRDALFTNRGLMECVWHQVPVGVLREREVVRGARPEYDVVGLAVPVAWNEGYFLFEGVGHAGVIADAATETEVLLATADLVEDSVEDMIPDDYDARLRVARQIVARRGQKKLRTSLLDIYSGRCVITGTDTSHVLEAAHIRPYRGIASNILSNALLLRADLHTLLDLQLLGIHPDSRQVHLSRWLSGPTYREFDRRTILEPNAIQHRPGADSLEHSWRSFQTSERDRSE